jgi:hypothetical protein
VRRTTRSGFRRTDIGAGTAPLTLETARLSLRLWTESDVDAHRVLVAERGGGMPSIEDNRWMIEDHALRRP